MSKHHYLPATYLARFSNDKDGSGRDRMMAVGDKQSGKCFRQTAGNAGCVNDLYKLSTHKEDPELLERLWVKYEGYLSHAIDELIAKTIDARTWARILVPFVAGMLLRGPEFNDRYDSRMTELNLPLKPDNTTSARMMELQRILAPILAAKWLVLETEGEDFLFTNDVGFAPYYNAPSYKLGIAIPLGKNHILGITPERKRVIACAKDGKWYPIIEYHRLDKDNHIGFNKSFASFARRFIYGSDETTIKRYLVQQNDPLIMPEVEELGFINGRLMRVHEFTWHRLIGVIESHPDSLDAWNFSINWSALADGWTPFVYLPTNFPFFPPAIARTENNIIVDLYDVIGYTTPPYNQDMLSICFPPEQVFRCH